MPAQKDFLCRHCGETDEDKFYHKNQMKTSCKKCHTLRGHQKQRLNKVKAIEYLGGKCSKCNYVGVSAVYDFHHVDPNEKEFAWGDKRTSNWETLKKELDKCVLLCANCHRELHDAEWYALLPDHHPEKERRILESGPDGKAAVC